MAHLGLPRARRADRHLVQDEDLRAAGLMEADRFGHGDMVTPQEASRARRRMPGARPSRRLPAQAQGVEPATGGR